METVKLQSQIRQNAEEVSSYLTDISKWEKSMNKKPSYTNRPLYSKSTTANDNNNAGIPIREAGTIKVLSNETNINKADDSQILSTAVTNQLKLTPASIIPKSSSKNSRTTNDTDTIPKALGVESLTDPETAERERGNDEFKSGNYVAAIKSYTKCLGMKQMNYTAFSNRAMAFLKTKEYNRAEMDCDCALSIEPKHCKSLLRRSTARNALGKHRGAIIDLLALIEIEPSNKQAHVELQKTRDMLKAAIHRTPYTDISPTWEASDVCTIDDKGLPVMLIQEGPDLPLEAYINQNHDDDKL